MALLYVGQAALCVAGRMQRRRRRGRPAAQRAWCSAALTLCSWRRSAERKRQLPSLGMERLRRLDRAAATPASLASITSSLSSPPSELPGTAEAVRIGADDAQRSFCDTCESPTRGVTATDAMRAREGSWAA